MNLMILTAVLGFVYVELRAVSAAMKRDRVKFDFGYYLAANWVGLAMNAVGTVMVVLFSPAVMLYFRHKVAGFVPDLEVAAAFSDTILAPLVGALIGLFGARLIRWAMNKGNGKLK